MPAMMMFCRIMGAVLMLVGVLGLAAGDHVLIFGVNAAHNFVHLLSGAAALICGFAGERASEVFGFAFGGVYLLVAALGIAGFTPVIEALALNSADNWLHLVVGGLFMGAAAYAMAHDAARRVAVSKH